MAGARRGDRVCGEHVVGVCVEVSKEDESSGVGGDGMRRWLPRFLWLLAWSGWAWLGVGLWRELPRDLGPVVCRLPLGNGEQVVGFFKSRPVVVTCARDLQNEITIFRLRDALNGAEQQKVS